MVPVVQKPMLVTFGDIADPTGEKLVDPGDLAAGFGPGGGRLKSVALGVMAEGVTEGVLGPATGRADNLPCYRQVHMGDFIRRP